eukprot:m.182632 g.182632  ORF g.182632 m.182632 type:complete len:68 (-) comp18464_c0_seq8:694-897(-)
MGIGTAPVSSELRTVAREVLQAAGYIPGDNYFLFAVRERPLHRVPLIPLRCMLRTFPSLFNAVCTLS